MYERLFPRKFSPIVASDSGDTTIVAAVPGKSIVVLYYFASAADAVIVKFKGGSTDLTGPMTLAAAGDPLYGPENSLGHFATGIGQPLVVNLSDAVALGGSLAYNLQ